MGSEGYASAHRPPIDALPIPNLSEHLGCHVQSVVPSAQSLDVVWSLVWHKGGKRGGAEAGEAQVPSLAYQDVLWCEEPMDQTTSVHMLEP